MYTDILPERKIDREKKLDDAAVEGGGEGQMEQDTGQTLYIIRPTKTRGDSNAWELSSAATALLLLLLLGVWKDRLIGVQWCFK